MKSRALRSLRSIVMGAALLTLLPSGPLASAQRGRSVNAEVTIVLAKQAEGTIAPELTELAALQRAPFNAFRSMEILDRPRVSLREDQDVDIRLPNGRQLRLKLHAITPDGRYRVGASINRPNPDGESDYLPLLRVVASAGDPFIVAGQSHNGGTLVIVVRLAPQTNKRR